jgi:hypothetical protein
MMAADSQALSLASPGGFDRAVSLNMLCICGKDNVVVLGMPLAFSLAASSLNW